MRYEIWPAFGKTKVLVFDVSAAKRLNRYLGYYPRGTRFIDGDEPVFVFESHLTPNVIRILRSLGGTI